MALHQPAPRLLAGAFALVCACVFAALTLYGEGAVAPNRLRRQNIPPQDYPPPATPAPPSNIDGVQFGYDVDSYGMEWDGKIWTRRDLMSAGFLAWEIPVLNKPASGEPTGHAENVKAQVTFSMEGQELSKGFAPWQGEALNVTTIAPGETKYLLVAVDPVQDGSELSTWRAVYSNAVSAESIPHPEFHAIPTVYNATPDTPYLGTLDVRLLTEDGKLLRRKVYAWSVELIRVRGNPLPFTIYRR